MLNGDGNENGEKTTISLINKKKTTTLHKQHPFVSTFLCPCFVRPRETSRNFLITRFMEEMSYLLLFTFFHSLICTLVAARISQFLTAAKKCSCCFSNK